MNTVKQPRTSDLVQQTLKSNHTVNDYEMQFNEIEPSCESPKYERVQSESNTFREKICQSDVNIVDIKDKFGLKEIDEALKKILDSSMDKQVMNGSAKKTQYDDDQDESIEALFDQFKNYVKKIVEENVCKKESLDKHLMKRYFDKIIKMNGVGTITDIFKGLNELSRFKSQVNEKENDLVFTNDQNQQRMSCNTFHMVNVNTA